MTAQEKRIQYLKKTPNLDRCKAAMDALGYVFSSWARDAAERRVGELGDKGIAATIVQDIDGQHLVII